MYFENKNADAHEDNHTGFATKKISPSKFGEKISFATIMAKKISKKMSSRNCLRKKSHLENSLEKNLFPVCVTKKISA